MKEAKSACCIAVKLFYLALLIVGCYSLPATNVNSSDIFAYPAEQSAVESKQNARNRTPIYIPKRCGHDEILYPGDHETDWVCDCKPTFVYHPATQTCYQMYTRGFCAESQVLYIKPDGKVPECIPNRCGDGKVEFNDECVTLNEKHRSCNVANLQFIVGINERTHDLECINISAVRLPTKFKNRAPQNVTTG